jgi:hypothetical protein
MESYFIDQKYLQVNTKWSKSTMNDKIWTPHTRRNAERYSRRIWNAMRILTMLVTRVTSLS